MKPQIKKQTKVISIMQSLFDLKQSNGIDHCTGDQRKDALADALEDGFEVKNAVIASNTGDNRSFHHILFVLEKEG